MSKSHTDRGFYLTKRIVHDTFSLTTTNEQEVFNAFTTLSKSKTFDIDHLPIKAAKFVVDIAPCLVHIYNSVLSLNEFPSRMKLASVRIVRTF